MVIAIDGPAGSGKTTVAKLLAGKIGFFYLDTGATYRALTLLALENNVDLSDEDALCSLAGAMDIKFKNGKTYIGERDVSSRIRTPLIDKNISPIVAFGRVREGMVGLQRRLSRNSDCVVEGRDTTTVVFPAAEFKFYLDADSELRARRRHRELLARGIKITFDEVRRDLEKRDYADTSRALGPLRVARDAIVIDTGCLTVEGVVDRLARYVNSKDNGQG